MPRLTDTGGRPQNSQQSQYPMVALVTDNVDPDELGRIQVKFPHMESEPVSWWVRQASPNGGMERGFYALPEKDDEVLMVFLHGDFTEAVIIGQMWNGVDKPPAEAKDGLPGSGKTHPMTWSADTFSDGSTSLSNNDRRFWKSRSGHLFVFDDSSGAESVQIWDKDHNLAFVFDSTNKRILLTNSQGDIHIRCQGTLFLESGKDIKVKAAQKIEGESGMDTTHKANMNLNLEAGINVSEKAGANFDVNATANYTAKANAMATVEGSATATFKGGGMATFEGGGMATLKGGIVMIN